MALGPEGCDVPLAQAARLHSINNCVVLGSSADGPQCLQGLLECSAALPGPAAGNQGGQWW